MTNFDQWDGFDGRLWKEEVNTRDFIQHNYKPYEGDESFLAGPTEATDKLWGILRLTEGSLAPVSCLEAGAKLCEIAPHCRTLPMWTRLNSVINEFFDSYTIADLMQTEDGGDYVI